MKEAATRIAGTILALAFLVVLVMSAEPTAAKAPTAPPQDVNQSYAQRATWFIDRTLEGQYAAALQVGSDRFKRDIGEKGLRYFRDTMAKYGKGRFVPTDSGSRGGVFHRGGPAGIPRRPEDGRARHLQGRQGRAPLPALGVARRKGQENEKT